MQVLLALDLAAAMMLVLANTTPLMSLGLSGRVLTTTVPLAAAAAWRAGEHAVSVLTLATALVAPALLLSGRIYLLLSLSLAPARRAPWPGSASCARMLAVAASWSTVEVMCVAALLALVRVSHLADAHAGPALWALAAVGLLFAACETAGASRLPDLVGRGAPT